ncbi:MAG: hypothetical protein HFJ09_13990 [Lachnospiraceae bacterium]|nr:hypothetical protein [Lachnospiraceae bacterium]
MPEKNDLFSQTGMGDGKVDLWVSSSGNLGDFANKAKVAVTNGYVRVTGKGELTTYINVYRTKIGYIYGCLGNP